METVDLKNTIGIDGGEIALDIARRLERLEEGEINWQTLATAVLGHRGSRREIIEALSHALGWVHDAAFPKGFTDELNALVMDDFMAHDPKVTAIQKLVDRYYLKRPLFEDGEPVQFGSEFMGDSMEAATVAQFCYHEDHVSLWSDECSKKDDEYCKISFYSNDRKPVKRPSPKVLDADGVEINVGDTVWLGSDELVVASINEDGTVEGDYPENHCHKPVIGVGRIPHSDLTHTPPDTQERIDEDALLSAILYCDKYGLLDSRCDAEEGDKAVRHCSSCGDTCEERQKFDLLRRQRELDGRES